MIFDPIETASREELDALQLERLRATVGRVLDVPLCAGRLAAAGVTAGADIASLADLADLPFTTKDDLRTTYPLGLHAVTRDRLARVHVSTGTGGRATVAGYTLADLETWTHVMARCLATGGVQPRMTVQLALGFGLLTGGPGFQQGAERLGALVVPAGIGDPEIQARLLRDLGAQVLGSTPSYAVRVAEAAGPDCALERGLFGAEMWSEAMRATLERGLGIVARNIYGLSEVIGPGVSVECDACRGLHVQEDHFLPEIVDPDSGASLAPREEGELVLTTLTKEALPLLRYRTGDITTLDVEPCACGRTLTRMSAVRGRSADRLTVAGAHVFPSDVEQVLLAVAGVAPHWQLAVSGERVTVRCEPADPAGDRAALEQRVRAALGAGFAVELVESGGIPRSRGKAQRIAS